MNSLYLRKKGVQNLSGFMYHFIPIIYRLIFIELEPNIWLLLTYLLNYTYLLITYLLDPKYDMHISYEGQRKHNKLF